MKNRYVAGFLLTCLCAFTLTVSAQSKKNVHYTPEVTEAIHHDISPALRDLPDADFAKMGPPREHEVKRWPHTPTTSSFDGALQTTSIAAFNATQGSSFDGIGLPVYAVNAAPPDTNGAVGATQYVQWVNEAFGVFSKTGTLLKGPVAGNTLWQGFGGGCETNNDGDPIVQWDKAASRWVLTQFSVSTTPYLQCVAVSTSSDATGTYARYAFQQPNFNDYPKLGVWPDAYYTTFNIFSGNSFVGGRVCAFDRTRMLTGAAATQQCFQLSNSFGGLLPSDLDGTISPPAGSPDYVANFGSNVLNVWKFHVDWTTPANSTLAGPTTLPVASFTEACGGGTCVPQSGTRNQLDSLGDRLMYRLAYRHFADGHEALVVNHSVKTGGSRKAETDGVRWYELRISSGVPSVFQQGTFAPNSTSRWMGSAAMDKVGDIAIGYSISSGTVFPSIGFTGRVPTDTLGTLEAENQWFTGSGSQTGTLHRWGDYSSVSVDPSDDCTFWYTTEYLKSSGSFNWSTRIGSFKFASCQ